MKVEVIDRQNLTCGEGPIWDYRNGRLYWTDAMGQAVYFFDHARGQTGVLTCRTQASAVALHAGGGVVLGTKAGFFRWNGDERFSLIAADCEGKPATGINDMIVDPRGRIFGGQEVYQEEQAYEPGFLFRLDPDGSIRIVAEGLAIANGMGFSPEGRTFYLIDSVPRCVYAYDYDLKTGDIRNRRTLLTLGYQEGLPDGMTVDEDGFLWIARWFGGGLSRYDPDGRLERRIHLPVAQPSSVMFGGPDLDELYVTSACVLWKSPKLAPRGHDYDAPRGGQTFRIRPGVRGKREFLAA